MENNGLQFDLRQHFEASLKSMFESHIYGPYELQVLKTMAAFGEAFAAELLANAYDLGEFDKNMERQPLEKLKWALIQRFLEGDQHWALHAENEYFESIKVEDGNLIVHRVRTWINEHPIAHSAAICASEKLPFQQYYISDIR